jgi:hypothetical protein
LSNIAAFQRNHFPPHELKEKSSLFISPPAEGLEMSAGLFHIESAGPVDGDGFSGWAQLFKAKVIWLPAILLAGLGGWMVLSGGSHQSAVNQPTQSAEPAGTAAQFNSAPTEAAPVNGLRISSQSWRRGGLGSKALITFTLRNDNDYAVGDIGLLCAFTRADGSPVTERRPTIRDTVKMKSRKTFARMHVGFVNVNASRAKCTLLSASRV